MDGKGYITREDFLRCIPVQRLLSAAITQADVLEYLVRESLFKVAPASTTNAASGGGGASSDKRSKSMGGGSVQSGGGKMDVDSFKRTFFPQYFQVEDDYKSDDCGDEADDKKSSHSQEAIVGRLAKLEHLIKVKLASNWGSVRKAFLDLDSDYDGFVTVEDILRVLGGGGDEKLDFKDLTKLIVDKDQKREGKISYTDFSKWLGGVIQQSEGFYFRHDSHKNPQYDKNMRVIQSRYETLNKRVLEDQIQQMNLE